LFILKLVLYAIYLRIKSIMLIQIAEDAAASRDILRGMLKKHENEALVMANELKCWQLSQQPGASALAILGWIPEQLAWMRCRALARNKFSYHSISTRATGASWIQDARKTLPGLRTIPNE
jgi:hypothetical protein